ncbi:MAG: pectinesterase family protein [Prevotella sp.]|nr:pectinesterase family protein [Prevotella sp.]
MKKRILKGGLLCLFSFITCIAWAQSEDSSIQEKQLYTTSFTEWSTFDRKNNYVEGDKWAVTTKYSHEDLTFELHGVGVDPTATISTYTGYMITAKYTGEEADGEPYVITTPLASITKIELTQAATGGTRGIKVSVKGDGDDDWVAIHNKSIGTSSGEDLTLTVNRTNCQIKFESFALAQNAYVTDLAIYGNIDTSLTPSLGTFSVNGTSYDALDIFEEDSDGNMAATIEIPKDEIMISQENPLADVTTLNGDITSTTYEVSDEGTVVTIVVTANGETVTYKLTVIYKPDYTLYYMDTDGTTQLGTQIVEKDAAIGQFEDLTSKVTVTEGKTFRGWFVSSEGGQKYTTEDVITEDTYLYAVATETETMNTTARYSYALTDEYFYAEDHEAFEPTGGSWHDATHGWAFSSGDKIDLLVGGHAYIMLTLCSSSSSSAVITLSDAEGNVIATVNAKGTDGAVSPLEYTGGAGTLTLSMSGTTYLHALTIANVEDKPVEKNDEGYYVVKAGDVDHLLTTLEIVNSSASSSSRTYIFIPDGTYDLGSASLTPISGANISIIGQSMENTIIKNNSKEEGISITATFLITGNYCYMQDLTLQNEYPYYNGGAAGRAVCIQDKANRTICKNVRMLSYQDTYYSNNSTAEKYFETSDIHGTVDFICGDGAVYFNECTLTVEPRNADGSGACTITAPATASGKHGYIFNGCTIDNYAASYNFGRAWQGDPECVYLNTTLSDNKLISDRWTTAGMNVYAKRFYEYNTMDANGNVVSPVENTLTFTYNNDSYTYNTILTADEAAEYAIDKIFTSWTPTEYTAQKSMDILTGNGNELTWNTVDGAIAYAVFNNGEFVDITGNTSYTVTDGDIANYTVRAANEYGGFGDAASTTSAGISNTVVSGNILRTSYYSLQGARVSNAYAGLVIKVDTMDDGQQVVSKIIK